MLGVKGKVGSFVPAKARKTKKQTKKAEKQSTRKILCCSDIHKFGNSQKYQSESSFNIKWSMWFYEFLKIISYGSEFTFQGILKDI